MTNPESRLDLQRRSRLGMVEAIWGENKSSKQIAEILRILSREGELALVTRVDNEKAKTLKQLLNNVVFHKDAQCVTLGEPIECNPLLGEVIVLTGGTSDIAVAAEAELALRWHGIKTKILCDVGVSGLHRLLNELDTIRRAKVLIACAGMEGALPTVLAGLVPQPVIGLPISVGYGTSKGGKAALAGMLSSCAPGLVVVNIDNGYGAAMSALRILKL